MINEECGMCINALLCANNEEQRYCLLYDKNVYNNDYCINYKSWLDSDKDSNE